MTATVSAPVDALRSCPGGEYADGRVVVRPGGAAGITATPRPDGRITVTHRLRPAEVDDELGGVLAAALAPHTDDHDVFVRAFTGLVLTTNPHATEAWALFYRNSLARIRHRTDPGYSGVYRHALTLLPTTSVVDLGCSFGFLALHLAERGADVTACDVDTGTTALVRRMARRLGRRVEVGSRAADLATGSADAVALLHVLEHVDRAEGQALLGEAMRIARRRVVVAVPYEQRATGLYGHVRRLDAEDLHALGAASGWRFGVHDHLGGWLVLDRPAPGHGGHPTG